MKTSPLLALVASIAIGLPASAIAQSYGIGAGSMYTNQQRAQNRETTQNAGSADRLRNQNQYREQNHERFQYRTQQQNRFTSPGGQGQSRMGGGGKGGR